MKKRILGVALGAVILFGSNFISTKSADAQEISSGPTIICPKGKKYVCYVTTTPGDPNGPTTSKWKGKGEVVIIE